MTPRISLLAMGGTISTRARETGATPELEAEELISGLRARNAVEIRTRDVRKVSSRAVTPTDMWNLARAIEEEIHDGVDGVVITHGTDTLEETVYGVALLVATPVPVVFTGAMRPPYTDGADGPANLRAALIAAAHAPVARYGPVVVFHDEIHTARWLTKHHSSRLMAFASPSVGPVGIVVEGQVEMLLGPTPHSDRLSATEPPSGRVELLWAVAGADGFVVDAIAEGIDGLVVAGTGGGHVTPALADALVRLAKTGCPVVLSSRCGASPRVLRQTYSGNGSEMHLLSAGLHSAGSLPPLKARLRLLFGFSAGLRADELFPSD